VRGYNEDIQEYSEEWDLSAILPSVKSLRMWETNLEGSVDYPVLLEMNYRMPDGIEDVCGS